MDFYSDLKRFGRDRAVIRDHHRDVCREFRWRQYELGGAGAVQVVFFLLSGHPAFAMIACLLFTTGARECWRMRACGRYWQCKRSMEVIGI